MDELLKTIGEKVAAALPGAVVEQAFAFGELTLTVDPARNIEVLTFLRDDPAGMFISIIDISGADYPVREKRFDARFYLVSLLFIIFDLEVAFLFPWAIVFHDIGALGFWSMILFLAVLTIGFVYEWNKGALEWD